MRGLMSGPNSSAAAASAIRYSVVVPFYNEAENLPTLIGEIDAMLGKLGGSAEIILVNDGSTDAFERPASSPNFPIRWMDLERNAGQSAALFFGMQAARGEWVVTLDADLQNDPADVPALVAALERGRLDMITGVRVSRQDTWKRRIHSRIANAVRSRLLGDGCSDTGCSLKVMRRELAQRLPAWNGMHRFMPALAVACGYRTGEAPVTHRARHAGVSKVRPGRRALRATVDLLGMLWLSRRQFRTRVRS